MIKRIFTYLALIICVHSYSQEVLSLDAAIKTVLEKNYSVLIAKNETEIAKAQNNLGNAGMSPTVSLNGSLSLSNLNSYQEFNTGATQDREGAKSSGVNASLNASWMIFDGLKMFAIKKRLSQNEQLSNLQAKQNIESVIYNTIIAYNSVVKQLQLIKAAEQNLNIYEERKKIAELKYSIGSDSKIDLLLATTDVNTAKSNILQLNLQLLNAKTTLNNLMNKNVDNDFVTSDSIIINFNPELSELKRSVSNANSSLLISKQNEQILGQTIKEAQSANLPFLQLNAGYNFTRSQSQAGFVFLNRQNGVNASLTAGWIIFNGNKNNRLVKEKNISLLNQKFITEQLNMQVDALVYLNYKTFELNKEIIDLEKQNLSDSKELLTISIERYKLGKSAFLETIETQRKLEEAQVRYINAVFAAKVSETELLRANGNLVK